MKQEGPIERCMWILLATFPVMFLRALPDQRSAEERWGSEEWAGDIVYDVLCTCGDFVEESTLPPAPPFDLVAAERDVFTDAVGGFQQLAHVGTPLSGVYPYPVRGAPPTRTLDLDHLGAIADP